MRLRDYKFDTYKTKKKDDDDTNGAEIFVAVEEPAVARVGVALGEAGTSPPVYSLIADHFLERYGDVNTLADLG